MMHRFFTSTAGLLALALLAVPGCTMKETEGPPVSGPSEYGTSITISIDPDILEQDGVQESRITISARGPDGAPVSNRDLRADIFVDGVRTDFGLLSTHRARTGSDGTARLTYRAPAPVPGVGVETRVQIGVTPIGTDQANTTTRWASLLVVPVGGVPIPPGLQASFTFDPSAPAANQTVLFDASGSRASPATPIATYIWDFGNGRTASGRTPAASTEYRSAGTFVVKLTIVDSVGRSATTSRTITVSPGVEPTVDFVFSPAEPAPGQVVTFNASATKAAPGRTIADRDYVWHLGDGPATVKTGLVTSHAYAAEGTYTVTLTVTDDAGQKATRSQQVTVETP